MKFLLAIQENAASSPINSFEQWYFSFSRQSLISRCLQVPEIRFGKTFRTANKKVRAQISGTKDVLAIFAD